MADTTNRLAGIATLTIDGASYAVVGDLAYRVSKVNRESLVGQDGVHGYKEMPTTGMMSATLRDAANLSVASLNAMTNSTVIAELANGKTIVGRNMWAVDVQEVKTADAALEFKLEGPDVSEQ
jgi:hypothetical protein